MKKRHSLLPAITVLLTGLLLVATGIYGIYYQALFWTKGPAILMTADELAMAFALPTTTTLISTMESGLSPRTRQRQPRKQNTP